MKKYILSSLAGIVLMASTFSVFAEEKRESSQSEANIAEDAKSAILIERDTGEVLFDKNSEEKLPPASMTKIMTLLLIMEALETGELKKDETIRVSERASSMGGSQIFLEAGEEMSVDDLLKGIAVASGNDASVAVAERLAGSEEAFADKMNRKAKELNLKNTHFENATGLPADNHYSTSQDMAIIAKELLKYESITDYTSIYEDYLRKGEENEFWLVNTNKLVKSYPGVDGLKTGFTDEAKYCLTATAKKEDMRAVAVVMGAETTKKRNETVTGMLDYAFNHYETEKLFEKGQTITTMEDFKAEEKNIKIKASQSVSTLHKKGEQAEEITTAVKLDDKLDLPMKKGDQAGTLIVNKGDEVLSETPLIVDKPIHPASYFTLLKRSVQSMTKYH